MAKADRILDFFPAFHRAADRTKLLHEVTRAIAQPMEEADTLLFRIQRAHRLRVAEEATDIVRLAAALNLSPFHFEDILGDESLEYDQKLMLMRSRVQRIAAVHLRGLGTPRAVIEAAAIFLNGNVVPERAGEPLIKQIDDQAFSHRVTVEFTHLSDKPREQIHLHESPFRRKKVEPAQRWQLNSWAVDNRNFEASDTRIVIQGVGEHTVLPTVYCAETEEGLFFNGIVPGGKTLVIDELNGAMLDGEPVDEWLGYYRGAAFDFARADGSSFVQGDEPAPPFGGDLASVTAQPYRRRIPVPAAPAGRSHWSFRVAEGVYDGTSQDFCVFATAGQPIGAYDGDFGFDSSVFEYAAAGVAGMAWDERIPCAFKLMLPLNPPQAKDAKVKPADIVNRVGRILPRFKAAGIRAFVDTAKDAWILGKSVIRDSAATEGVGFDVHATRLQNPYADMLVPLEAET